MGHRKHMEWFGFDPFDNKILMNPIAVYILLDWYCALSPYTVHGVNDKPCGLKPTCMGWLTSASKMLLDLNTTW